MSGISTDAATGTRTSNVFGRASLGSTDFLRLMTEQMKQQDPFAPQDNSQMIAQLAQISSSSGISDLNTALSALSSKADEQTRLLQRILDGLPTHSTNEPSSTAA